MSLAGPVEQSAIDTFLQEHKPSSNSHGNGLGGWYWVHSKRDAPKTEVMNDALVEGGKVLEEALIKECERIKKEEPTRANKKEGKRSQKDWREEAYAKFSKEVYELAQNCGCLSGKWLFYPLPDSVDFTWAKIVNALAAKEGALAKLKNVSTAKVSDALEDGSATYVICVYCDDSFDKEAVGEVFKVLVKELGLISSAYKTDAFTHLGINSKHPTGVKSSLYGKNDFIAKAELDAIVAARKEEKTAAVEENAKAVKSKTLEQELEEDQGFGAGGSDSDSEAEKPKKKKAKKN